MKYWTAITKFSGVYVEVGLTPADDYMEKEHTCMVLDLNPEEGQEVIFAKLSDLTLIAMSK